MKPIDEKDLGLYREIQESNEEIIEKVKKIDAKIEQIMTEEK